MRNTEEKKESGMNLRIAGMKLTKREQQWIAERITTFGMVNDLHVTDKKINITGRCNEDGTGGFLRSGLYRMA